MRCGRLRGATKGTGTEESVMDLKGAVAVVTGGNGGLGQRICHALAKEGVHIAVTVVRQAAAMISIWQNIAVGCRCGDRGAFFEPGVFGWPEHACRGCSLGADQVAHLAHLNARDNNHRFERVSARLETIEARIEVFSRRTDDEIEQLHKLAERLSNLERSV
jgi:NAD(P)-dependent dehydrogenase (short-subunit alcohol dehydrogenase family)